MEINTLEFEKQKRQAIIDSGKYLQFEILIGTERESIGNKEGIAPCVKMNMCKVGMKQVSDLYLTLLGTIEHLEKEFPEACLLGKLTGKCTNLGSEDFDLSNEEE